MFIAPDELDLLLTGYATRSLRTGPNPAVVVGLA